MRKVQEYTVAPSADNRDSGKTFVITEMSVTQSEAWAVRALLALGRGGSDVPPEALQAGFAGVVPYLTNLVGSIRWEDAKPLLDEMMTCVQLKVRIDSQGTPFVRKLVEDDIEEGETLLLLRKEVVQLHKDFLKAVVPSGFLSGPTARTDSPSA